MKMVGQEKVRDKFVGRNLGWHRKIAILLGTLFITDLVVNSIGSTLIEGILEGSDYLTRLSENQIPVMTGVLLETVCALCLLAIGILMYPILKMHSGTAARGYYGVRIVETVIAVSFAISHLMLFALSQDYVSAGAPDAPHYETMGALLMKGHDLSYQIYLVFYGLGSLILFGLFFKTRLVPRFISVWGLVGVAVAITGLVADMFGSSVGMEVYAMPLGLCQIFLAIWLIAKGFDPSAIDPEASRSSD
jgi:hypothetical protein